MSEAEIQAAAHECMTLVLGTMIEKSLSIDGFNNTQPFEECIRRGIEKANDKSNLLCIGFNVPESTSDIQMMSVWSQALDFFIVTPEHKTAALKWFQSYAKSEIKKQKTEGERNNG